MNSLFDPKEAISLKTRRPVFLKAFLVILLLFFASCSAPTAKTPPLKTLRINIQRDPATFDPRKGGDLVSAITHFVLFEGLTRLSQGGMIELAGAEAVVVSEDKKTYTFLLRESYSSKGEKITADDYVNSWKSMLDPNFPSPNSHLLYEIKNAEKAKRGEVTLEDVGIKVINDKTFVVILEQPCPYFLHITAFCSLFPYLGEDSYNGPFIIDRWSHNCELILKKNPNYSQKNMIDLDEIKMLMIPDEMTALHLYDIGELDIIGAPTSHLPLDALLKASKKEKFYKTDAAGTSFCVFNTQKFPFNNVNLRKAFSYAINRKEIVSHVTQLGEKIATGIIPTIMKEGPSFIFKNHDEEKAKEFLDIALEEMQISKSELEDVVFLYPRSEVNHLLAQTLQQQWRQALGIKIKLQHCDSKTLFEKFSQGDFVLSQATFIAQYYDPINFLERFKNRMDRKNYSQWEDAEFTKSLQSYQAAASNEERTIILNQAEEILFEEMPIAPLFHLTFACLVKPHLKNIQFTPMGSIYLERISIPCSSSDGKDL